MRLVLLFSFFACLVGPLFAAEPVEIDGKFVQYVMKHNARWGAVPLVRDPKIVIKMLALFGLRARIQEEANRGIKALTKEQQRMWKRVMQGVLTGGRANGQAATDKRKKNLVGAHSKPTHSNGRTRRGNDQVRNRNDRKEPNGSGSE